MTEKAFADKAAVITDSDIYSHPIDGVTRRTKWNSVG